jgi:hypothetical protein
MLSAASLVALGLFAGQAVHAQGGEAFDRTPQDCVVTSDIDKTRVTDDHTILFYMRRDVVYRNVLPRRCPGLDREDRFMYETRSARLCSTDTITVLEQWGARLTSGFTCRLGEFHPVSPEEVEDLEADPEDALRRESVQARPAQVPPAERDDAAAEAAPAEEPVAAPAEEDRPRRRDRRRER